jgi:hypothetical protein
MLNQQDYILRIIEMAGRFLAELRRAVIEGGLDPHRADDDIIRIGQRAGLDLELLRRVDLDTLVLLLSPGGEPEAGRIWLAAELFAVDAERRDRMGDAEGAVDSVYRALRLYAHVDPGLVLRGLPEVPARVTELRALLDRLVETPPPSAA